MTGIKASLYHNSYINSVFNVTFIVIMSFVCIPLILIISILLATTSGFPVFFIQKRIGRNGKSFNMYKFRTMKIGAEAQKEKLMAVNEVDGPVFKIQNDPRFTVFGKILSKTGLDELPQFYNIVKRDMNLVGPRPLPLKEAKKLNKSYKIREIILPGIISTWVIEGMHNLKFKEWMNLDKEYVLKANLSTDISIILRYMSLFLKMFYSVLTKLLNE